METERAAKLFQARFPDVDGQPLVVDGKVGSITWAALFGEESVPATDTAPTDLKALSLHRVNQIRETRVERGGIANRLFQLRQDLCLQHSPAYFEWLAHHVLACQH